MDGTIWEPEGWTEGHKNVIRLLKFRMFFSENCLFICDVFDMLCSANYLICFFSLQHITYCLFYSFSFCRFLFDKFIFDKIRVHWQILYLSVRPSLFHACHRSLWFLGTLGILIIVWHIFDTIFCATHCSSQEPSHYLFVLYIFTWQSQRHSERVDSPFSLVFLLPQPGVSLRVFSSVGPLKEGFKIIF